MTLLRRLRRRGCCLAVTAMALTAGPARSQTMPIQHVIIIMQENRSFDHYFGTFPGANGFPQGICVPLNPSEPQNGCVAPFEDPHDQNAGGGHTNVNAQADLDDGISTAYMDGFIYQQTVALQQALREEQEDAKRQDPKALPPGAKPYSPGVARHDVMGYHTDAEIPNYWAYAEHFVLQDNMFEGVRAYSLSSHIDMTSEWVAKCSSPTDLSSCVTAAKSRQFGESVPPYPWVNLPQLLDTNGVSWKYYVASGQEPDCDDDEMTCEPQYQKNIVVSLWNPVPGYAWVRNQGQDYVAAHIPDADQFLLDVQNGTLPQVAWVVPQLTFSEHPAAGVTAGMEYVTSLINAVMQSPYWQNTAIFVAWDDWGGFYDHVVPPNVDFNGSSTPVQGFGLRVPGLMISAYAQAGTIDHSVLSTDSYATFIEDLFINSTRLDPVQMGQPDNRPDIRDALTMVTYPDGSTAPVGDLMNEFDFTQQPLPPLVLSTHIPTAIDVKCGSDQGKSPGNCTRNTVTIDWRSVSGAQVPGPFTYQVLRDGTAVSTCTVTTTTCNDINVPSGAHIYTAYTIDQNNVSSPPSAGVEADVP